MSSSRYPRTRWPLALVGAGMLAFSLLAGATQSSFTLGRVINSTDTALTGGLTFTHAYQATSCTAGPAVTATVGCAGSIATSSSAPSSSSDSITNNGNIPASKLTQTLRATSCGPVQFANAKTASDPLLARFATAFQVADKWGTVTAVGLSGTAYATDVVATDTASLLGGSYSLGLWFRTPTSGYAQGGGLLDLSASPSNVLSATSSPMIWMNNGGNIVARIAGTLGTSSTVTSAATYNDGSWHFALLSVTASLVVTPTLYVDAATGVSVLGVTALTGGNAYWHVGWADFTGVTAPSSRYFPGSVSGVFVRSASSSSAERTTLFGAASAGDYSTKALALGNSTHLWMLGDTGTTTFGGSLPASMAGPCGRVNVSFAFTNPAGSVGSQPLSNFLAGAPYAIAAPAPGATQSVAIVTAQGTGYAPDMPGIRLYSPLTFRETTNPTSATWQLDFTWADASSAFIS